MTAKHFVQHVFRTLGFEIARWRPLDQHSRRQRVLERRGIELVLDVGANVGTYGRFLREHGYGGRIISFEPVEAAYTELRSNCAEDRNWDSLKLALSDSDGEAAINVADISMLSSFLPHRARTEPTINYAEQEIVPTARLDSLELVNGVPTLLKLDVQGFEDHVLAGAEESLRQVDVIECELSLVSLYEGQPTFRRMLDLLEELGYQPIGFTPNYVDEDGRVVDCDGLFARPALTAAPDTTCGRPR